MDKESYAEEIINKDDQIVKYLLKQYVDVDGDYLEIMLLQT
jgi:hypothetical protein